MNNPVYESQELTRASQAITERCFAPLGDRQEAKRDYAEALRTPGLVAARIGWLLNGSYGYGEMRLAERIVSHPRMNRIAALSQLVASCEWQCPDLFARAAWKGLSTAEQARVNKEIEAELTEWESGQHAELP